MADGDHAPSTSSTARLSASDRLILGDQVVGEQEPEPDRRLVESFLAALIQSEHLNLLVGSGLTTALGLAAKASVGADMAASLTTSDNDLNSAIESAAIASAEAAGRGDAPNVEDRLRVALSALSGLRLIGDSRTSVLERAIEREIATLRDSVVRLEAAIAAAASSSAVTPAQAGPKALIQSFLNSFGGRVPTRDRLHIFTTNYDRAIEWGAEAAGLRLVDRFVGSLEPIFRSSRLEIDYHYTPPGSPKEPRHLEGVVRLTKLHGSLDWRWRASNRQVVRSPSAFGQASQSSVTDLLIYPNAAKDIETTFYPYADLFRDFSAAICRPNATLVTYGYSFGDDHVNRIVRDMLSVPSTHLLVISYGDDGGRVSRFVDEYRRTGQVSLMLGPAFGDLDRLTKDWLPRNATRMVTEEQARLLAAARIPPPSATPTGP